MLLNKNKLKLPPRMANLYSGSLPVSRNKLKDLQVLKKFCSPLAAQFFDLLPQKDEQ